MVDAGPVCNPYSSAMVAGERQPMKPASISSRCWWAQTEQFRWCRMCKWLVMPYTHPVNLHRPIWITSDDDLLAQGIYVKIRECPGRCWGNAAYGVGLREGLLVAPVLLGHQGFSIQIPRHYSRSPQNSDNVPLTPICISLLCIVIVPVIYGHIVLPIMDRSKKPVMTHSGPVASLKEIELGVLTNILVLNFRH